MHPQIAVLYNKYNETLRPLVSEIEGRNERFEEPLLLNIASMFDSIALSEADTDENKCESQVSQAMSYLDISISQSYQYLIKNLDEKMIAFEKRCNASDRGILDRGQFIGKYNSLRSQAKQCVRKGRNKDDLHALADYESAYKHYSKIEKLIDRELPVQVMQNTRRNSHCWTFIGWISGIFISVVVGKIVNNYSESIISFLKEWMNALQTY